MSTETPAVRRPVASDPAKTQKLLELVKGDRFARSEAPERDEVLVWPHLVVIEAVSAAVFTVLLTLMSIFFRSPLESLANPSVTPNPSKAPWYFLNLQELLLHMDAGLAGVVIPTFALLGVAAIPYIDRDPTGVGRYFPTRKGRQICIYAVLFTSVVEIGLVLWDNTPFGPTPLLGKWNLTPVVGDTWSMIIKSWAIPGILVLMLIGLFIATIILAWRPTTRELVIGMFTAFAVSYWLLAIIGTGFRGESQHLVMPWDLPAILLPNPPPVG